MGILLGQQAAVSRLGGIIIPPPTREIIAVGADLRIANTRLGMTSVSRQARNATTTALLVASGSQINNQPIMNHGADVDIQPGAGAAYNWSFTDATFGLTAGAGYFPASAEMCMTAFGCPPHMRVPKPGTPPDPQGPFGTTANPDSLTSLSSLAPVHSSWFSEYGDLVAAAMARYPHVKYLHPWVEMTRFYFATQYPGSALVPPGSGLPARTGSNRWWTEGYVAMYNLIWQKVKAVRPDAFISGPYHVLGSFAWDQASSWTNGPFPDLFMRTTAPGAWGYGDKKVLSSLRYFIQYCSGADALNVDIRNDTADGRAWNYYAPTSVPAATDVANKWTTNPDGGTKPRYWIEGDDGPWHGGQKQVDFIQWVRDLGASNAVYQRPVCDARTLPVIYSEWYAHTVGDTLAADPHTGNFYTQPLDTHQAMAAQQAWQYIYTLSCAPYYVMNWKPEGSLGKGGSFKSDPSESNPLGLWDDHLTPTAYQQTEMMPVYRGLIDTFPPGTQLKTVTSTTPLITGMATPTNLMVVSRSPTPIDITADGKDMTIGGYEVLFLPRVTTFNPSGFAMPTANPTGMTLVFEDDFSAYPNIALGSFPANTNGRWGGYAAGTGDTRSSQSGNGGIYDMGRTITVTNGVLDIWCHNAMVGANQVNYAAAPWPIIPGNQPTGIINGHDYGIPTNVQVRANIWWGQVEYAFRVVANPDHGWKTAWLLWPDFAGDGRQNGEIDFPEGDLDDVIKAFMHWQNATPALNQTTTRPTTVPYGDGIWHKGKIVWLPTLCEFYLDDVKIGASITTNIPANPMHLVLQTETVLIGSPNPATPVLGAQAHVQLDWIRMHQKDGVYP